MVNVGLVTYTQGYREDKPKNVVIIGQTIQKDREDILAKTGSG